MHHRFLLPALLLTVAACHDAPTAVSGPSPPLVDPPGATTPAMTRGALLADPLTVLIAGQLGLNATMPQDLLRPASLEEPLDSADLLVLQATLDLIREAAAALPDSSGGQ